MTTTEHLNLIVQHLNKLLATSHMGKIAAPILAAFPLELITAEKP